MFTHVGSLAGGKSLLVALIIVILAAGFQSAAVAGEDSVEGRCYYIDAVGGDDGNDGSVGRPWRSFGNVITYYKPEYRPEGWVELQAGDCVCLMDGVYDKLFHPGAWKEGAGGGGLFVAYFRGRRGESDRQFHLKAYSGHKPVIDGGGKGIGISIFQSSCWAVEGVEVRNAWQRGISLNESKEIKLHDVHIHDTDGVDNNNIAGLYITGCRDVEVYDCVFNDNYDRTCADTQGRPTENSCNVVVFAGTDGGDITIHDCLIYNRAGALSADGVGSRRAGGGIKYKHASRIPESYFHVHHNRFSNCRFFAFGSGTANTHFHDNIIVGPTGISSRDFGGVTHQVNQVFENNIIYVTGSPGAVGSAFQFNPTTRWRNDDFREDPKDIVFKDNIVYDRGNRYSNERGIVTVGTYMSDDVYDATVKQLRLEGNSYYNPKKELQFNIAAGFNYKDGYRKGGVYSMDEWRKEYGYDMSSRRADPLELDGRNITMHDQARGTEDAAVFEKWEKYLEKRKAVVK